jgi:hypothetical protein
MPFQIELSLCPRSAAVSAPLVASLLRRRRGRLLHAERLSQPAGRGDRHAHPRRSAVSTGGARRPSTAGSRRVPSISFREEIFRFMPERERIIAERIDLVRSWNYLGFNVNADRHLAQGNRQALASLLEYMERPPVSMRRLEYRGDRRVLYRDNFHPSLGRENQLVSGVEVLVMLVPRIASRFGCRRACGPPGELERFLPEDIGSRRFSATRRTSFASSTLASGTLKRLLLHRCRRIQVPVLPRARA